MRLFGGFCAVSSLACASIVLASCGAPNPVTGGSGSSPTGATAAQAQTSSCSPKPCGATPDGLTVYVTHYDRVPNGDPRMHGQDPSQFGVLVWVRLVYHGTANLTIGCCQGYWAIRDNSTHLVETMEVSGALNVCFSLPDRCWNDTVTIATGADISPKAPIAFDVRDGNSRVPLTLLFSQYYSSDFAGGNEVAIDLT